ncbi:MULTISPECIES: hypothetical protein [Giesbergeria]|uniref:Uncharacterized protein n=1 Tax=Giesbergeria sinuosa TaxID=80883 RepID=A0ABV9QGW6_9BURK
MMVGMGASTQAPRLRLKDTQATVLHPMAHEARQVAAFARHAPISLWL